MFEAADFPAPVVSFGDTFLKAIEGSLDPSLQRIAGKYIVHYDFGAALGNASQGNFIMGESRQFLEFNVRKRFTNNFGETRMHIMQQCLTPYRVALALSKGNPLTGPFSEAIQRLVEAGLSKKWLRDELDAIARLSEVSEKASSKPWTLDQLQGAFFAYGAVSLIACVTFGLERTMRRSPRIRRFVYA